jgi:hypothetical protein
MLYYYGGNNERKELSSNCLFTSVQTTMRGLYSGNKTSHNFVIGTVGISTSAIRVGCIASNVDNTDELGITGFGASKSLSFVCKVAIKGAYFLIWSFEY